MLTSHAVGLFLAAKKARGLSPRTVEHYSYRLAAFALAAPDLPLAPEVLEQYLARPGWSPQSRDTVYRLLRNLYRWLERRGHISMNPIVSLDPPILPRRVARSLNPLQLRSLLTHPDHPPAVRAMLTLLADTGLRLSEAHCITLDNLTGAGSVIVDGKTDEHEVPISPLVENMVRAVLPWPWSSPQAAGLAVRKAFKRAGIGGPRASAHTLRHTFCRSWRGDESLLVGILGWTSPRMMRVYRPFDLARAIAQHRAQSSIPDLLQLRPLPTLAAAD